MPTGVMDRAWPISTITLEDPAILSAIVWTAHSHRSFWTRLTPQYLFWTLPPLHPGLHLVQSVLLLNNRLTYGLPNYIRCGSLVHVVLTSWMFTTTIIRQPIHAGCEMIPLVQSSFHLYPGAVNPCLKVAQNSLWISRHWRITGLNPTLITGIFNLK